MLQKFILVFVLLTSSATVFSQAALFALLFGDKVATENFNVSLELGIASSSTSGLEYEAQRSLGAQFGIGFNIKLNDNFTLSPGAYFLSNRAVFVSDAPVYQGENVQIVDDFSDATLTMKYIDVPVKFYYTFSNSPWSVGIAPQIGFLTGSSARYSFSNNEELSAEIDDAAEKIELGSQFFIAHSFKLSGKKILILGLRYYQGFTNALRDDFAYVDGDNRSNYFGLSASFPFIAESE